MDAQQIMDGQMDGQAADIGNMALGPTEGMNFVTNANPTPTQFLAKARGDSGSAGLMSPFVWYIIMAIVAFILFCMVRYTAYRYAQKQRNEQNAAFKYGVPTRESWMDEEEDDLATEFMTDDESMQFDAKSRRSI
jgi:hypothetical protein